MAVTFPNSPSNGQRFSVGSVTYIYSSGKWSSETTAASGSSSSGGTVTTYSSINALPLSGNDTGDQAFVSENNRLYIWTGDGWYNIALVNTDPSIQANSYSSSYELSTEGTATTVTLIASDPEGVPITWTYANSGLGSIATISQSNNVFTITPTSNAELGGTFSVTFKASDGVNLATATSEFTLNFVTGVENSKYTTALITSVGSNGGKNSTATDSSTNNHTLTLNGGAKLESFSPYRSGGYSYYFDGTDDYLDIPYNATLADWSSTDYTIEAWVNYKSFNVSSAGSPLILRHGVVGSATNYWSFGATSTGTLMFYYYSGSAISTCVSTATLDLNTWHHIVMSYNNTDDEITLYLDGVSVKTHTVSGTPQYNSGSKILIGENNSVEHNGYITDLRITTSEVYTADFTPSTERLTAITNTELLTCHLPYLKDGSSNDHSITVNGDVSVKPFGPYNYTEYDSATHGGSIYFDGTDDTLTLGNSSSFAFGTGDFTIDFWINSTGADNKFICDWRGGSTGGGQLHLTTGGYNGTLSGGIRLAGDAGEMITTKVIDDGQWHHVAVVRSSGTTTIYIDGEANVSQSDSINYTKETLIFCRNSYNANLFLPAYLSDFRIVKGTAVYTADFTPPTEPVTAITNTSLLISSSDASIVDKSQTQSLTLVGDTQSSTSQTKYASSSMYFDGSGDYIRATIDGGFGSGDFTFEFWLYKTSDSGYMFNSRTSGTGSDGFDIDYALDTTYPGTHIFNTVSLNTNQWYHIAYVRSGSTFKRYINGSLNDSTTNSTNFSGSDFYIGGSPHGNVGYLSGYMEDVRITKGLARYTSNFTPPTASLEG